MTSQNFSSFVIREAIAADVSALAMLHVATFNETHGVFPQSPACETRQYQWRQMFEESDRNWFCLVIENENEELIGFAKGQPYNHHSLSDFSGELNKIYLLKKYHRLGLGKKLLYHVASEFVSRNIFSMLLFGDERNPSNGFYEAMGGEKLFAENGEFHGGYGWKDLKGLILNC